VKKEVKKEVKKDAEQFNTRQAPAKKPAEAAAPPKKSADNKGPAK